MKLYPNVSIIFIVWILSVLTVAYFGFVSLPHSGIFTDNFFQSFANWDGGHYLAIAQFGYVEKFQYAFFPLYPMLIRFLNQIFQNYLMSALLISFVSAFLAINFFFTLVSIEFGKRYAQKAVLLLLSYPLSFYLLTAYTEGLFLLLAISTFLFTRRGNLFSATVASAMASATRPSGIAVVFSFLVYVYFSRGYNTKNWYVLLSLSGILIYCLYLYSQTGDPFYFIQAQLHWHTGFAIPGSAIFHTFKQLLTPGFLANNFRNLLDFVMVIFGLSMIFRVWKRLSVDYAIFSILSLIMPLFSQTLVAMPRYLLTIFPIFMVLALLKNQYALLFYQFFSLMLLVIFATLFLNGYWSS